MKREYTAVIEINGQEKARSGPGTRSEAMKWLQAQCRIYNHLMQGKPWRTWLETASTMQAPPKRKNQYF